jgi:hypothetical protein
MTMTYDREVDAEQSKREDDVQRPERELYRRHGRLTSFGEVGNALEAESWQTLRQGRWASAGSPTTRRRLAGRRQAPHRRRWPRRGRPARLALAEHGDEQLLDGVPVAWPEHMRRQGQGDVSVEGARSGLGSAQPLRLLATRRRARGQHDTRPQQWLKTFVLRSIISFRI